MNTSEPTLRIEPPVRAWPEVRRGGIAIADLPPFLCWRALVLCCPRFYPGLPADARAALLGWAGRVLAHERFDPAMVEELFP